MEVSWSCREGPSIQRVIFRLNKTYLFGKDPLKEITLIQSIMVFKICFKNSDSFLLHSNISKKIIVRLQITRP